MKIQIRERKENKIEGAEKQVEVQIVGKTKEFDYDPEWSFECISSPVNSTVMQSNDSPAGVYLAYTPNEETPTMSFLLSDEGTYRIKIHCRIGKQVLGEEIDVILNADGTSESVTEVVRTKDFDHYESVEFDLIYDTSQNLWN